MNPTDNRMHAWIGSWILIGLAVIGFNGYMLLSLLDEPLAGHSPQARSANRAFRQYRILRQAKTKKIVSEMDLLVSRFGDVIPKERPMAGTPAQVPTPEGKKVPPPPPPPPVTLPALTGIVSRLSADGTTQWTALINGSVRFQGDQLGQLTIQKIDSRGIVVVSDDRSWFIKTPDISFSLAGQ
ncbi:MAG: hypothetical protein CR984_07195 [Proteobacteria bacterium]|nr:MAG: hypothetical protein CR984_07195 [Pseudomonadota bacterium]